MCYLNEQNYSTISRVIICERLSGNAKTYNLGIDENLLEVGDTLADAGIDIEKLNYKWYRLEVVCS